MRDLEELRRMRTAPEDRVTMENFTKAANAAVKDSSYVWMVTACQPVDAKYTDNTFEQGDRVKSQLENKLSSAYCAEFDYQGSVTADVHIRRHSDIDLLVISGVYTSFPPGHPIDNPVSDQVVVDELQNIRKDASRILSNEFPEAVVDTSGSKAISISGGSLTRDVDVVLSNWWNTEYYLKIPIKANRGIKVLSAKDGTRIGNMPFLHNYWINHKDELTEGGLRKAIRLLKTLKYTKKPKEASISSYDIAAICYNMDAGDLKVSPGSYLTLGQNVSSFLGLLANNQQKRDSLEVPNGTRKVFCSEGANLEKLQEIRAELNSLLGEISQEARLLIAINESSGSFVKTASSDWKKPIANRVRVANELLLRRV